jgi:hypothetical protein
MTPKYCEEKPRYHNYSWHIKRRAEQESRQMILAYQYDIISEEPRPGKRRIYAICGKRS